MAAKSDSEDAGVSLDFSLDSLPLKLFFDEDFLLNFFSLTLDPHNKSHVSNKSNQITT